MDKLVEKILFNKSECDYLLSLADNNTFTASKSVNHRGEVSVTDLISSNQVKIDFNLELKNLILNKFFELGIKDVPKNITLIKYIEGDYLEKHIDNTHPLQYKYKTCIIQLSDEYDYEGGEFIIHEDKKEYICSKKIGNVILFPSSTIHQVKKISKGVRFSIVIWFEKKHFTLSTPII